MKKKFIILIFTDLDGSLLNRDTFKFDEIKKFLKDLVSKGIFIIPNSSKTENEIIDFNQELGENLTYISENGSVINGLNLLNINFPDKIVLSREKNEIQKIFESKISKNLKDKCKFITRMEKKKQIEILGLSNDKLKNALSRKYSIPFLFDGNKNERDKLNKSITKNGLSLQEGGRVINLCDKVNKVKSMNRVIKIFKKIEKNIKVIAVGDNYNDLEMLKNSDVPCLVFNDRFKLDEIFIDNLIISNQPSPLGWADVIKKALVKLDYNS